MGTTALREPGIDRTMTAELFGPRSEYPVMRSSRRPPVSVILPTREWGLACRQLSAQLMPDDELLIVCDTDRDPVADHDTPEGARVLVAGEPTGSAAKANAVAHGMERASNDRFVWADDDYDRGSEWLDHLVSVGEEHGPAAYEPLIVSDGLPFKLLEPVLASGIALYDFYRDGGAGGYPWGGGVTFTRDELQGSTEQLCRELRESISDDNALENYLEDTYAPRQWNIRIPVDGGLTDTVRRLTRWMRADHVRYDITGRLSISIVVGGLCLLAPLVIAPLTTAVAALSYLKLGYRRWTFLLAYPGLLALPFVFALGLLVTEFRWGNRRYRLNGLYDIEVERVSPSDEGD